MSVCLDKFLHLLANWEMYLSPWVHRLLPLSNHNLMLFAGAVEMAAGLLVAIKPRIGAAVVAVFDSQITGGKRGKTYLFPAYLKLFT